MFALSIKNGNDDSMIDSFDGYYMLLVKIKDFNALFDKKPFFDQPVKRKRKAYKNVLKYKEMMTIQQEIYYISHTIKIIINLLL